MSDFDFFDDPDTTDTPAPAPTPEVSRQEFDALAAENKRLQQKQHNIEAFGKALSGEAPQQSVQDPYTYASLAAEQAFYRAKAEMEVKEQINAIKQEHPYLVPWEKEIRAHADSLATDYMRQGVTKDTQSIIKESVDHYKQKFQEFTKATSASQQEELMRKQAIPFQTSSAVPNGQGDLKAMMDKVGLNNPKGWKEVQKAYYTSKGLPMPDR